MRTEKQRLALPLVWLSFLLGCDGENTIKPAEDAGAITDSGLPDVPQLDASVAPTPLSCASPGEIALRLNEPWDLEGDTSALADGELDLGYTCGNYDATHWAPQHVYALQIPDGADALHVEVLEEGTSETFRPAFVMQARSECTAVPTDPVTCLTSPDGFTVEAGTTVYLLITGYSDVEERSGGRYTSRGQYRVRVIAQENEAPTIVAASYVKLADRYEMRITADDSNGDLRRATFALLNAELEPIDIGYDLNGDGAVDYARYTLAFEALEGDTSSQSVARSYFSSLVARFESQGLAKASVFVEDDFGATSETQIIDLTMPLERELGEACTVDRTVDDCLSFGACDATSNLCVLDPEVEGVCNSARVIHIATPLASTTSELVVGFLPTTGTGQLMSSCRAANVPELVYNVTVPDGVDLVATTDVPETAPTADTVLSVRSDCVDFRSEFDDSETPDVREGCNDDLNSTTPHSAVTLKNLPAGTYTLLLEPYAASAVPITFGLKVALRPVLTEGAACDPTEENNRCGTGTCVANDKGYSCTTSD